MRAIFSIFQSPWKEKTSKAVFRGATTNYDLTDGNWGANPRVRLHRLSEAYPMALDVRIHRWSHATPEVREEMEDDEIRLGGYMNFSIFNAFKYQVRASLTVNCSFLLSFFPISWKTTEILFVY